MTTRDNDGPAFPTKFIWANGEETILPGMDLRDYFAAKAMQAIVSYDEKALFQNDVLAEAAYKIADAMLVERGE